MKYHLDQEVVTGFISEAKGYLPEIVLGLEAFAAAPERDESIKEAFRYAHIIKGAASMLGFHQISEVAYELEMQLEQLSEQQLDLTQELLEDLCQNVGELSDLLETAMDDDPTPAPSAVMSELPLPALPVTPVQTTDFDFSFSSSQLDALPENAPPFAPPASEAAPLPTWQGTNFSVSLPELADTPTVGELNLHEVAAELKERFGSTPLPAQPEIPLPSEWLSELPPRAITPTPPAPSLALGEEEPAPASNNEGEYEDETAIPDLLPLPELPTLLAQTTATHDEMAAIFPLPAKEAAVSAPQVEDEEPLLSLALALTLSNPDSDPALLQSELPEDLLETFLLEAEEHLQIMQAVLRQLEQVPSDVAALQEIRRSAHSLKGTASLVGFRNIMHLAHRMEDLLDLVYEEKFALTLEATHLLTRATDMLEDMSGGQIDETALHDLYADFATLLAEIDEAPEASASTPAPASATPLEEAGIDELVLPVGTAENVLEDLAGATILELPPLLDEAAATLSVEELATWELSLPEVEPFPASATVIQAPASCDAVPPPLETVLDELAEAAAPIAEVPEEAALPVLAASAPEPVEEAAVAPVLPVVATVTPEAVEEVAVPSPVSPVLASSPLEMTPPPLSAPLVSAAPLIATPVAKASTPPAAAGLPLPPSSQFLRVPIERLDEVVKLIGEMMITRTTFEQRLADFARQVEEVQIAGSRLRRASTDLETKYEVSTLGGGKGRVGPAVAGAPPSKMANSLVTQTTHGFDDLEFDRYTEFHLLSRELNEASSDIQTVGREFAHINSDFLGYLNRQSRIYNDLQDRLMRLRMVPLASVAPRLQRAVRQASGHENKLVELVLEGENTAIDTTALQDLIDPLLHLLRNAVAHGIEAPAARQAQGKSATGRITLRAFYEGSQVVLQLSDDGYGLDEQKIRAKALRQGLLSAEEAATLTPTELWPLIFTPGFTTTEQVSEIAGRGVGMDVVQTTMQKLKGSITIASQPGAGVSFTLRLPLTLAVMRALLVKSGEQSFAIPLEVITQIMRLEMSKVERIGKEPVIRLGGKMYPLLLLSQLLNLGQSLDDIAPRPPVLLMQIEGREVAVIVDQLLGGREIVIKTLGTHLRKVHGVMGATLLGGGEAVLILNLTELVRGTALSQTRRPGLRVINTTPAAVAGVATPDEPLAPEPVSTPMAPAVIPASKPKTGERPLTVMVVDDSPSVRRVNTNLIKNTGWIPVQAKDGLEALEKLQAGETMPDLIMLDIEMPRMDGYQLLASLRALSAFRHLPVVIVSSRASEKHRQKAFDLGATDYLVKPYQEEQVVALIRRLVQDGHQ